jgi:hypothetical protein
MNFDKEKLKLDAMKVAYYTKTLMANYGDYFNYLYNRWQDEKGMESFDEYRDAVKKKIDESNVTFHKMTSNPFNIKFIVNGLDEYSKLGKKVIIVFTCTKTQVATKFEYI